MNPTTNVSRQSTGTSQSTQPNLRTTQELQSSNSSNPFDLLEDMATDDPPSISNETQTVTAEQKRKRAPSSPEFSGNSKKKPMNKQTEGRSSTTQEQQRPPASQQSVPKSKPGPSNSKDVKVTSNNRSRSQSSQRRNRDRSKSPPRRSPSLTPDFDPSRPPPIPYGLLPTHPPPPPPPKEKRDNRDPRRLQK